jgi:hypothetical protein
VSLFLDKEPTTNVPCFQENEHSLQLATLIQIKAERFEGQYLLAEEEQEFRR